MKKPSIKMILKENWIFYFLAAIAALTMRAFCQVTDSDALTWILTPTSRWAGVLGGIPFEYLPHMGYVNHFHRFLIAPSCSGIRFMTITFLMLAFSFLHQLPSTQAKCIWFGGGAAASYLYTVFVNGIRITVAIYLPIPLEQAGLLNGWLDPDRLHTLIGTVIYFFSLCMIYPLASSICRHGLIQTGIDRSSQLSDKAPARSFQLAVPAFWYLLMVLAIPFAGRILRNDWAGFGHYAALITGVCLTITAVLSPIGKLFHRQNR